MICYDQHLTWPCNHIYAYNTCNLLFCFGNILIAWTDYHIDPWNGPGAICKCCNGPGTPYLVNFINAYFAGRNQQGRMHFSFFIGRSHHNPLLHPGNSSRNAIHQYGRNKWSLPSLPPRNIESCCCHRPYQTSGDHPVITGHGPGFHQLLLMKKLHPLNSQ